MSKEQLDHAAREYCRLMDINPYATDGDFNQHWESIKEKVWEHYVMSVAIALALTHPQT
jgi:hypothetical protein